MAPLTHILAIALLISYYTPTILVLGKQTNPNDCLPSRCSNNGPVVRFPFRLDTHAPHCGYDPFVLSCSGDNTVLRLPFSGDYNVTSIDYNMSMLVITRYSWTTNCPWSQIAMPNVTSSIFIPPSPVQLSWLDCSDVLTSFTEYEYLAPISCLGSEGHFIYVAWASTSPRSLPSTCIKIRDSTFFTGPKIPPDEFEYIPSSPSEFQHVITDFAARPVIALYWLDDLINCSMCEKKLWHRCEFNFKTKSFCRESRMVLKAELGNITSPYYLPGTCKWKAYELQCDGNDTVLYIGASKYLVKDISMENMTLRVVDPDLALGSCRLPKQTTFTEYPSIFDSYNNYIIYFFNCTEKVEDSMYKLIDCMDGRSRVYAAYDSGITGDIPNSCSLAGHTVADYVVYKHWNDTDGVDMMKMLRWGVILRWDIIDDDMCSLSSYCWISTKRDLKFMMRDRELTTGDKLLGVLSVQSSFLSCIHYPPHYEFGTNSHLVLGFMIILVALLDILLVLLATLVKAFGPKLKAY
ncbi:serine/threonine-protein kinase [Carex littledalei]|uniref:RING-type E3 ubiquitin transferase n=1 Tax=Carex littledalei TaxID=544730 RepID=A0A833RIY6_9POAL|nr:serine/threonine-protein kinase [Carex littledalei]